MNAAQATTQVQDGLAGRAKAFRNVYPLRILGLALSMWMVCSVLLQTGNFERYGWFVIVIALLWPHLAYLHARNSGDPYRAELRNLLVDSALVGLCLPLMHFNLLPSVVLVMITTYDKLSTGIKRLWWYSLPGMALMALLGTLVVQPQPVLASSLHVIIATMPLIVLHGLAVSYASYRLIRTVARQNGQLHELRRRDAQTGLFARAHWQERAQEVLDGVHDQNRTAWLLMIDIDHFKRINDQLGHTIGDEAIRIVGEVIRDSVRGHDCAGRYGGDEFCVLCIDTDGIHAKAIAERIRRRIESLRIPHLPELRLTSSIGLAPATAHHTGLTEWLNAADAALYQAKRDGRNQVVSLREPDASPDAEFAPEHA